MGKILLAKTISVLAFFSLSSAQAGCDIEFSSDSDLVIVTNNGGSGYKSMNGYTDPRFYFKYTNRFFLGGLSISGSAFKEMVKEAKVYGWGAKDPQYGGISGQDVQGIWTTQNLTGTNNDVVTLWSFTTTGNHWLSWQYEKISYEFNKGVFKNADLWWCEQNVSAGTEQTGTISVTDSGTSQMLYWMISAPPSDWFAGSAPQVRWREIPSLNITLITPTLDFGTAYTGIPVKKDLKFTLTSNVISAPVNVTYTVTPVIGSATVNIVGATQNGTEQIITSTTKNNAKEITRIVEITGPDGATGGYEGRLQIDLEIP